MQRRGYISVLVLLVAMFAGGTWWLNHALATQEKEISLFVTTNEIKWTSKDGQSEIETYRWDPGTLVVHQGDQVRIRFYGVKGAEHPFIIDGYNLKGVVQRGKETDVTFRADQTGTFTIRCLTHYDVATHGPMEAYLTVLPK